MTNNIPTLFDPPPTLERRDNAYHNLQPRLCKTQHECILAVLLLHPLLRYDEIPYWYLGMFKSIIKESSVVARLNEMVKLEYVSADKEKLNCSGNQMVTAYQIRPKGIEFIKKP